MPRNHDLERSWKEQPSSSYSFSSVRTVIRACHQTWFPSSYRRQASGDAFGLPEFVAGCGSGAHYAAPWPLQWFQATTKGAAMPKLEYVPTRIPTTNAKEKARKNLAAHQEQDQDGQKRQAAGQDGARKSLIDGTVHDGGERFAAHEPRVFADAVKDHNRVIHRITDQGQQRRNHRQRNLKVKNGEKAPA